MKEEGGYEIVLKSLDHYKRRLRTMGDSPELKDAAAMFAAALQQEARKTVPIIDQTAEKVKACLSEVQPAASLEEDVPFIKKALTCYLSDIRKAQDTGYEYFVSLVGDLQIAVRDIGAIEAAQGRIAEYAE